MHLFTNLIHTLLFTNLVQHYVNLTISETHWKEIQYGYESNTEHVWNQYTVVSITAEIWAS